MTADFLGVNQHEDIWYFNKEKFEQFIPWLLTLQFLYTREKNVTPNPFTQESVQFLSKLSTLHAISTQSEYKVEKLKELSILQKSAWNLPITTPKKIVTKKGNIQLTKKKKGTKRGVKPSNVKRITKRS